MSQNSHLYFFYHTQQRLVLSGEGCQGSSRLLVAGLSWYPSEITSPAFKEDQQVVSIVTPSHFYPQITLLVPIFRPQLQSGMQETSPSCPANQQKTFLSPSLLQHSVPTSSSIWVTPTNRVLGIPSVWGQEGDTDHVPTVSYRVLSSFRHKQQFHLISSPKSSWHINPLLFLDWLIDRRTFIANPRGEHRRPYF